MNILKKLKNRIQNDNNDNTGMGMAIYMTDDLEHAKKVQAKNLGIHIEYHSCTSSMPSPIHFYITNEGKTIVKRNPEYIEYLRWQKPDITEEEISAIVHKAYVERMHKMQEDQLEKRTLVQEEDLEENTRTEAKRPKQKERK